LSIWPIGFDRNKAFRAERSNYFVFLKGRAQVLERGTSSKGKDSIFHSSLGYWFHSWPFLISLVFHGLMVCFLMIWVYQRPADIPLSIVLVHIVNGEREKDPISPPPIPPKSTKAAERQKPNPKLPTVVFPTESDSHPHLSPSFSEPGLSEVSRPAEEKEKTEPAPLGIAESQNDVSMAELRKGGSLGISEQVGLAEKGISAGVSSGALEGEDIGGERGVHGVGVGEKKGIPGKGEKTGSIYYQGEGKGGGDLGSYLGNARIKIEKAKQYPREARIKGWEGKVEISFRINRKGQVGEIRIIQSSGYEELDREAIATLRRASPFSPPPYDEEKMLVVEIPLVFKLE
jgi:TonB family protein